MSRLKTLGAAVLAAAVTAAGFGFVANGQDPCPTPTPTAAETPTATPTATDTPTPSPTPTATPEPPSNVFYVSATNGSDTNPGTETQPWGTLGYAFSKLDPGETLRLRAGTYTGDYEYTHVGTAAAPITVEAYPGEQPILEPATREPLRVKVNASYTTFRGLTIQRAKTGSNYQNVYVLGTANHIRFERNTIRWALAGSGVFVDNTTSAIDFIANRVYENNEPGVQHQGIYHEGSNSIIARNLVYGHTNGFGIQIKTGADHIEVTGNVTADNSMSGILVMDTADHVHVVNNISAFNGGYGVRSLDDGSTAPQDADTPDYKDCSSITGGCQNQVENNLLYGNGSGACASSQSNPPRITCSTQLPAADPRFVNRAGRDYHVQAGSPAIDKAMPAWAVWPDADGNTSPAGAPDVGAYESR